MNANQRRTQRHHRGIRGGWSLIELLVVVGLITVLLGIIINTAGEQRGPEAQTRVLVGNVHAIATEYEVATGQLIPADPSLTEAQSITLLISKALKTEKTRTMLNALGDDFVSRDGAQNVVNIVDAWGSPIWFVAYNGGETNKLPRRGKSLDAPASFVASPGKDRKWGTYDLQNAPNGDAADNIYSFELR